MAQKILRALLYGVYLAVSVLAIDYVVFWLPFVSEQRAHATPEMLEEKALTAETPELLRLVGDLRSNRRSSFQHFQVSKPAGAKRVCAFGDSFTYGDEVGEDSDYPSLLARLFEKAGMRNVEVLNFGSSWHGFHQTFILWEKEEHHYGCDYTLLGPGNFFEARDTAFNHAQMASPYYIHARYVLDGNDVRLVEAAGTNRRSRFDEYWRFFPRWEILRYDRNPPGFLRAVIPRGRTLRNPFYYRSDTPEEEAAMSWRILLRKMIDSDTPVVMTNRRRDIVKTAHSLGAVSMDAWRDHRFPYQTSRGHNSAWGNQLLAQQYFSAIAGGDSRSFRIVTAASPRDPPHSRIPRRRALSEYRSLVVRLLGRDVGVFVSASRYAFVPHDGRPDVLQNTSVRSLLAILHPGESLLDAAFLPLSFEFWEGSELRLHLDEDPQGRVLDAVRLLHPRLNIGVAVVEELEFREKRELVFKRGLQPALPKGSMLSIQLDGRQVLRGSPEEDEIFLQPAEGEILQVAPFKLVPLDIETLPESGSIVLRLAHDSDGMFRIPLARWTKVPIELPRGNAGTAGMLELPSSRRNGPLPLN